MVFAHVAFAASTAPAAFDLLADLALPLARLVPFNSLVRPRLSPRSRGPPRAF
jgi:hypothetical protein